MDKEFLIVLLFFYLGKLGCFQSGQLKAFSSLISFFLSFEYSSVTRVDHRILSRHYFVITSSFFFLFFFLGNWTVFRVYGWIFLVTILFFLFFILFLSFFLGNCAVSREDSRKFLVTIFFFFFFLFFSIFLILLCRTG